MMIMITGYFFSEDFLRSVIFLVQTTFYTCGVNARFFISGILRPTDSVSPKHFFMYTHSEGRPLEARSWKVNNPEL